MCQLRRVLVAAAGIALSGCGDSSSPTTPGTPATGTPVNIVVAGTPPAVGTSSQFNALAFMADGSSQSVTASATWVSSNAAVATVNNSGMVTALSTGAVEVSATYATVRGSLAFTVAPPPTYTLRGTISDSLLGGGVEGATVTVQEASRTTSTVTDGAGGYSIAVAAGAVTVTATAPNYLAASRTIMISGDATLTILLSRSTSCPVIGFDDLQSHDAPFTTHTVCGVTLTAITGDWVVSTSYGAPAPFIQFRSPAGVTTAGEIIVTSTGPKFGFQSIAVYSSTTPIPYAITGIANSATVFTIQNTQPQTFGGFATVTNPQSALQIDTLLIRLTNSSAPCCANPMGFDNLRLIF
jgi:Bacterial Ig-like domain (group 2)